MTKQQTFDYLLIRLADWFIEHNKLNSYAQFNDVNDFGESKLKLLPFIICTANGERKDLFGRFNSFIADKDSGNIEKSIEYNSLFLKTGLFKTTLLNDVLVNYPTNNSISNKSLLPVLDITENDQDVIFGIENSIKHIKNEKDGLNLPELINYSASELLSLHKRQSSWRTFHSLPPSIMNTFGGVIPIDFLISEKSVLAHSADKRIFA